MDLTYKHKLSILKAAWNNVATKELICPSMEVEERWYYSLLQKSKGQKVRLSYYISPIKHNL